jgi:hypothetical protein
MADPTLTDKLLILLGDGADPEVFAWPCGANARNVSFTNTTGETVTLDCADPAGLPAALRRWVENQDTQISIEGVLATESIDIWRLWADNGTTKNVRIQLDVPAAQNGGYWTVPMICQSLDFGSQGKGAATLSATLQANGRRVWTDAS